MKSIRHTGIVVQNLESSLKFYHDLLGLKIVKDFEEEGEYIDKISCLSNVKLRMIKLTTDDGSMVELLKYTSHPQKKSNTPTICNTGCSHLAFSVDDVEHEYERLTMKGVKFNSPPCISPDGYAKVAICQDPDGVFIELVEVLK
jgi:catechol 2,3-dioxygenase-like lactoylglutathione lyase family enzyme